MGELNAVLIPLLKEQKVTIISGATDEDGGIKSVKLFAVFTYYKPGEVKGPGLVVGPIKQEGRNANVGESTLKNRFFQHNFDLKQECGIWDSIKIDVWTQAENFHGGRFEHRPSQSYILSDFG